MGDWKQSLFLNQFHDITRSINGRIDKKLLTTFFGIAGN